MTTSEIISFIENRDTLNQESLSSIQELAEKYPFFNVAQILLAKNKLNIDSNTNDFAVSALYVGDRKLFVNYLYKAKPEVVEKKTESRAHDLLDFSEGESTIVIDADTDENQIDVSAAMKGLNFSLGFSKDEEFGDELDYEVSTYQLDESEVEIKGGDLISDFISTKPKMPKIEGSSEVNEEDINSEIDVNNEKTPIYTETLAKVYANQRLFSKAIKVYEQLIVKYPEKNSYFASQIEKLRKRG